MRTPLKFFSLALFVSHVATAQTPAPGAALLHYALDSFSTGTVLLKDGTSSQQTLNYNTITGEMIFVSAGKYLAIANPEDVDTVFIGQRKFVPVATKFCEWLGGTQPALFAEYTCAVKNFGTDAGFGKTNSSAASPLTNMAHSGKIYELTLPADFELEPATTYFLRSKGKFYKLTNAQQAAKAIPAKKSRVDEWLKTHPSKFSNSDEAVAFVNAIQD